MKKFFEWMLKTSIKYLSNKLDKNKDGKVVVKITYDIEKNTFDYSML